MVNMMYQHFGLTSSGIMTIDQFLDHNVRGGLFCRLQPEFLNVGFIQGELFLWNGFWRTHIFSLNSEMADNNQEPSAKLNKSVSFTHQKGVIQFHLSFYIKSWRINFFIRKLNWVRAKSRIVCHR